MVGEEKWQKIPPPYFSAEFPVIVLLAIVGELLLQ